MKLQAHTRSETEKLTDVRADGSVPAICYGPDLENPISIKMQGTDFIKVYRQAGSSTIVDLDINGEVHEVLVKDVDYHPVSDAILHVDFFAIKRGQELEVEVDLVFVGEAPAEKRGLVVNQITHSLSVTCLPRNLVNNIEVDITGLSDAGDSITVADIQSQVGDTLSIQNDADNAIISVSEVSSDSEGSAEDAAEAMAEVLADKSEE